MSSYKGAMRRLSLLAGASLAIASFAAPAIAADTTVTIAEGDTQTTAVTASPASGDTYTLNVLGTLRANNANNVTTVMVQGSGDGEVVINNDGRIQGRLNFSGASGPVKVKINTGENHVTEGWHTGSTTSFGSGNDLVETSETGVIATTGSTTFNFDAGDDSFLNAGRLIVDRTGTQTSAGTLTLTGLETFDNTGAIILGSRFSGGVNRGLESDRVADDRLIAQGVAFTGSGDSRIVLDAMLAGDTQADCSSLTAADCVDFTGGSTAGSTMLLIDETGTGGGGALNEGITIIVGASAADHFIIDPSSPVYARTSAGGAVQKGLVTYRLVYDADDQKHMLVGVVADEGFQAATFAASAQETWRAATGSWLDRQADLRATPGGLESSNGFWARGGFSAGEREADGAFDLGGTTYAYDVGHEQRIAHFMLGADMLGAVTQNSAWVIGAMGGLSRTDVEFDATPTELVYTGFNGGVYGSWISGPLFVDAVFSGSVLDLNAEVPNMHLGDNVNLTQTVKSYGVHAEGGWRLGGEGMFVEPLLAMAFVRTKIEDIDVPGGGGSIDFAESYTSSRFGAGMRVGAESELMGMAGSYSLTARFWEESEGANGANVLVTNGATSTPVMDDFSGSFSEVVGSVNLYSGGGVSGFVSLGGKFADGYQSLDGSVGVRLRW